VHDFVHDDVGEEGVEGDALLIGGRERDLGDRQEHLLEFGLLHVLEHHATAALLTRDAIVVRQVEGGVCTPA